MKITFEELQAALVEEQITFEQFLEVLVDNFGKKKTRKILRRNICDALAKQEGAPLDWATRQKLLSDLHLLHP